MWRWLSKSKGGDSNESFPSSSADVVVPMDLVQFPNPITASIGVVTISKFGVPISAGADDRQSNDTGRITARVSRFFLESLPKTLSMPALSVYPVTKPSKWGVSV